MSSCEIGEFSNRSDNFEYVKYGTSFGECLGYCVNSISLDGSEIVLLREGWNIEGGLPDIKITESLQDSIWLKITQEIDFSAFSKLDTILGCPDCTDGGAEWLEVSYKGDIHKVVFEYMNEPEILELCIPRLRDLMEGYITED
jgi:hypothetical protein